LSDCVHTAKKSAEVLVFASKEIGIEINAEKTKFMVMSRDQHAKQNHNIKTGNRSFGKVEQIKYFETLITNKIQLM